MCARPKEVLKSAERARCAMGHDGKQMKQKRRLHTQNNVRECENPLDYSFILHSNEIKTFQKGTS